MIDIIKSLRIPLTVVLLISVGVNLLVLTTPIFMLQVFDRVINSENLYTLYGLAAISIFALIVFGVLDVLRRQIVARSNAWFSSVSGDILARMSIERGISRNKIGGDVKEIRNFISSSSLLPIIDIPWVVVFIFILCLIHPWLGLVALLGGLTLFTMAFASERMNRGELLEASAKKKTSRRILDAASRNSDSLRAMGMAARVRALWETQDAERLAASRAANERLAILIGATKATRLAFKIGILTVGAVLVINGDLTAGGMIAASVLLTRCLSPLERFPTAWRRFVAARSAARRLCKARTLTLAAQPMELPRPSGLLRLENVSYRPTDAASPAVSDIDYTFRPGRLIAVSGKSGTGKTTLCRMLVGVLAPTSGVVRLDERNIQKWHPDSLGLWVGYLSEEAELVPGTIQQNIQRFGPDDPNGVVRAAAAVGVDAAIRRIPEGYDTPVTRTRSSAGFSAGERRQILLARAFYNEPRVLVLDEPTTHLDSEAKRALASALKAAVAGGATVIVATHQRAILRIADDVMTLDGGRLEAFVESESAAALRRGIASANNSNVRTLRMRRKEAI